MFFPSANKKNQIAKLLRTTPEALKAFEESYRVNILECPDNMDMPNAKQAAGSIQRTALSTDVTALCDRIHDELIAQTSTIEWDGTDLTVHTPSNTLPDSKNPVTMDDILAIVPDMRPQLAGNLMKTDLAQTDKTYEILLFMYARYLNKHDIQAYHQFRQGLDLLDLDPITYEMLGMNPNTMSRWLPALCEAVKQQTFFRVPKTVVAKIPLPILQLTRIQYETVNATSRRIIDRFCEDVFHLDENGDYFVKTGTYSSKFDFRNAHVTTPEEVRELGEYLLYIQYSAQNMASPLNRPSIYGVSTTNEWVVREFIPDKENNPAIYKGLPLHTEYRVFVDFDDETVLGVSPYWEPNTMKRRFGHEADADSPHQIHDYIIFTAHEPVLMERYEDNVTAVTKHLETMLPAMHAAGMTGQWSVDIMQNDDDFWIIDMATAQTSALADCIPAEKRKAVPENWIPAIPELMD